MSDRNGAGRRRVRVASRHREAAVVLSAGETEAVYLPSLGMLGTSLKHAGEEYLALPGGVAAFRSGHTTGLPLLAPWANRLGVRRYSAGGVHVDLSKLDLKTDPNGLPIHGTMVGRAEWDVLRVSSTGSGSVLETRFDFAPSVAGFPAFPFAHEIILQATLRSGCLSIETLVRPAADLPVPISFGFHPYLRLPTERRSSWRLRFPPRRHLELDEKGLPTGRWQEMAGDDEPLADRSWDDAYELTSDDRKFRLHAGASVLDVEFEENFPFAQVYAPAGRRFVCIEPMTAPTNALVTGGYPLLRPGAEFRARFSLRFA